MFGVPYGEEDMDDDMDDDMDMDEFVNWDSCMEMYVDVPEVTRCMYQETEDSCWAVGTMNDQTLFGTCDELIMAAETGDLTFYGNDDECVEEEQASCMDDPDIAAFADFCYYRYCYNMCTDEEMCTVVLTVDGEDYVTSC